MASKIDWLSNVLFRAPCYIGLCTNQKDLNKELKRLKIPFNEGVTEVPSIGARTIVLTNDKVNETAIIVAMKKPYKKASTEELYSFLAHEAVHVWQEVRNIIKEHNPSSEFEAYAIQNISYNLFVAYRKA